MAENPAAEREPVVGGFVHPLQILNEKLAEEQRPVETRATRPEVRRIGLDDVKEALVHGWQDFAAHRTDVMFLCLLYPVLGFILSRAAIGHEVLALLFPLAAGFALIGPLAGTGLYEMNRRLELGEAVSWRTAFAVLRAPGFGAIVVLGLLFAALFIIWLQVALGIYQIFLGTAVPGSVGALLGRVFTTAAGWRMMIVGDLVGLLFALVAFTTGVVSFPMLIDGRFGRTTAERLSLAISTSVRSVLASPGPMLAWGVIVAIGLGAGSVPFFLGLVVVVPVLGHATWHLYRRVVA